ncbi:sensor histidine kinase [Flavobacterium sp.]|uniref:sensor histidine kinase n=3 Tax=Flavobacterium sp. TaxID=239 RepID=UPI0040347D6E
MPIVKSKYKNYIVAVCILVMGYGIYVWIYCLGLDGGIFNVRKTGHLPIAIDAASCFIAISASLLLQVCYHSRISLLLSRALASGVFTWCLLMLIRDFTSLPVNYITFGISPQTAVCFVILSIAFFFIRTGKLVYVRIIQLLLHMVTLVGCIATLGHFLNIPEFYEMSFIPMAVYTAISFILLSAAASLVNCNTGITALFTGKMIGNIMARRLFLRLLLATLAIGYIRILSHRNDWISPELSIAFATSVYIIISLFLIRSTSSKLNAIHRKRLIAEENFRIAVYAAPYALIISDRGGNIITVNECTKLLYGYRKRELIGRNVKTLLPPMLHEDYDAKKREFYDTLRVMKLGFEKQILARKKDGTEFPVEIILTPVRSSYENFMLATVIDITERKKQEEIIRDQLIELQLKNEEMEQFNYISSHDLQEPLRTMSNYIAMVEEDYSEKLDDEVKAHLGAMNNAVERMTHVVRSLLNFGKLGRKRKLSATNCNEIVQEVIADLYDLIQKSEAEVKITCRLPEFYAFKTELRQVFQNLISNAIKFQAGDERPIVKISSEKKGNFYEFSVADNGIGIDPKHHEAVFRIFERLNSEEQYQGHGIGLANCKKITEMHGGKIWVEKNADKGTIFKFTILNLEHE